MAKGLLDAIRQVPVVHLHCSVKSGVQTRDTAVVKVGSERVERSNRFLIGPRVVDLAQEDLLPSRFPWVLLITVGIDRWHRMVDLKERAE
jgi:hypothetical protein